MGVPLMVVKTGGQVVRVEVQKEDGGVGLGAGGGPEGGRVGRPRHPRASRGGDDGVALVCEMDPLVDEGDLAKDGHVSEFFYLCINLKYCCTSSNSGCFM
jgi:hypothetical protein